MVGSNIHSTIYKQTHQVLEFLCDLKFVDKYFLIQNIEILGIKS